MTTKTIMGMSVCPEALPGVELESVTKITNQLIKKLLIEEKNHKNKKAKTCSDHELIELKLATYNCHGIDNTENYVNELSVKTSCLFICEHWTTSKGDLDSYLGIPNKVTSHNVT